MRKEFIALFLAFFSISFTLNGQSGIPGWTHQTAVIQEKGAWESGIFQPFRYGLSPKLEINSHLIWMPLFPNAGIKLALGEKGGIRLSSEHSLSIPSVFLNMVSRKGTGGLLSPEFDFPFMASIGNSVTGTLPICKETFLSAQIGLTFTLNKKDVDPLATIDLPIAFPRMTHLYKGSSTRAQVNIRGKFWRSFSYEEGCRLYLNTRKEENFFLENFGTIQWASKRSFRLRGGYILTYGEYPFGTYWQLLPMVDIVFGKKR